jgi:hypothetical protein
MIMSASITDCILCAIVTTVQCLNAYARIDKQQHVWKYAEMVSNASAH